MVERMFLTKSSSWRNYAQPSENTKVGFLSKDPKRLVFVELTDVLGKVAKAEVIIIQSPKTFRYLVPVEEAQELLTVCHEPPLSYKKYFFGIAPRMLNSDPQVWYVKEFEGPHTGFFITGVELKDAGDQMFPPDWVGTEVTEDPKYQLYNLGEFLVKG